jgi:deoxyuridine 5'-triphosphate nucleotidohydrolase
MKVCSFCGIEVSRLENKIPPACKKCYSRYLYYDNRNERVTVQCDFQISKKCVDRHNISERAYQKNIARNAGQYICLQCSRTLKFSGRNNPNTKYDVPDFFFSDIENEFKAYILGFIASDGYVNLSGFSISIHERDIDIIKNIRNVICEDVPIMRVKKDMVQITYNSQQMSRDICKHLSISPGKKSNTVVFPNHLSDELKWHFIRGYFDGDGSVTSIYSKKNSPRCNITSSSYSMLQAIYSFTDIPGYLGSSQIEWSGNNALDFMGKIYDGSNIKLSRKYDRFIDWSLWQPGLPGHYGRTDKFKWTRTDPRAVAPSKTKVSDAGYDITIIKKVKTMGDVVLYDTGIKIQPGFGYYFDLVPRSSISKTGYMLANSLGIIDRTYIGPILVALRKVDKSAKDIELPCRIAQIVPRHIVNLQAVEVSELDETARGQGGFGSTGV